MRSRNSIPRPSSCFVRGCIEGTGAAVSAQALQRFGFIMEARCFACAVQENFVDPMMRMAMVPGENTSQCRPREGDVQGKCTRASPAYSSARIHCLEKINCIYTLLSRSMCNIDSWIEWPSRRCRQSTRLRYSYSGPEAQIDDILEMQKACRQQQPCSPYIAETNSHPRSIPIWWWASMFVATLMQTLSSRTCYRPCLSLGQYTKCRPVFEA